jgi:hypothetical protein
LSSKAQSSVTSYELRENKTSLFQSIATALDEFMLLEIESVVKEIFDIQKEKDAKATIIQKNWRGFLTRKLLTEYFSQMMAMNEDNYHSEQMAGMNRSEQYLYQQTS